MPKKSEPKKSQPKKMHPAIVAGIITAVGAIIGAVFTNPVLIQRLSSPTALTPTTIAQAISSMNITDFYASSGLMGDMRNVEIDDAYTVGCYSPPTCIRTKWQKGQINWAGASWQHPPGNWGDKPGCNLTGATEVVFWARGEQGGEQIKFEVADVQNGMVPVKSGTTQLSAEWDEIRIDIRGRDLSSVVGAFTWITNSTLNPNGVVFYLDDIQYIGNSSISWSCP